MTSAQSTAIANLKAAMGGRPVVHEKKRAKMGVMVHRHNHAVVDPQDVLTVCTLFPESAFEDPNGEVLNDVRVSRLGALRGGSKNAGKVDLVSLHMIDVQYLLDQAAKADAAASGSSP